MHLIEYHPQLEEYNYQMFDCHAVDERGDARGWWQEGEGGEEEDEGGGERGVEYADELDEGDGGDEGLVL